MIYSKRFRDKIRSFGKMKMNAPAWFAYGCWIANNFYINSDKQKFVGGN